MALDNAASVAIHAVTETEPVVEIARRKSPAPTTETIGGHQPISSPAATTWEAPKSPGRIVSQVSLPRDSRMPLVTSNDGRAKEALEAYRSLRTRLLNAPTAQGFRSIVVTSVGKSDGKTVTAFNLACCCAHVENLSVLLIDGDLHNRSLTKLIAELPPVGLADVMNDAASCEDAIAKTDVQNLYVMGAGSSDAPSELFSTGKWSQVIRWSSQHFRIVLVDALSIGASADFELIAPECDGVLLVVRSRSSHREALKMAIEQIDTRKLIGIVWNAF